MKREPSEAVSSTDQYVKAYYSHKPSSIKYLAKPMGLGGEVEEIELTQFCDEETISWSNSPYLPRTLKNKWLDDGGLGATNYKVAYDLFYPKNHLAICQMAEPMGKGICATETIRQGDTIGYYTGVLMSSTGGMGVTHSEYGYNCSTDSRTESLWWQREVGPSLLNAEHYRNYTSYIQHALADDDPRLQSVPKELRQAVVTSNVAVIPTFHLAFPALIFVAKRTIAKGAFLQYDYGEYWRSQWQTGCGEGVFYLYDSLGEIIGRMKYNGHFEANAQYAPSTVMSAARGGNDILSVVREQEENANDFQHFGVINLSQLSSTVSEHIGLLSRSFLEKFLEVSASKDLMRGYNDCAELIEGPELADEKVHFIKLELRMYATLFRRDIENVLAKQRQQLNKVDKGCLTDEIEGELEIPVHNDLTTKAACIELKKRLLAHTGFNWSINLAQKVVFLIGEQERLRSLQARYKGVGIFSESLSKRQGKWYLVYTFGEVNMTTVNSLPGKQ